MMAYRNDGQVFAAASGGAVLPGGHEFVDNSGGGSLLAALAHGTGGRANPAPSAVYDSDGVILNAPRDVATPLLWLALLLLPLDILFRRILFTKRDS
jgi:hypothetical protein